MKAIIFDTETSGLLMPSVQDPDKQPRIIEVGAIITNGTTALAELSQLINPGIPHWKELQKKTNRIDDEITGITGIKEEDLVGKPSFKDFLPSLKEFFQGADILIAHNAPFDHGMLLTELKLLGCEDFPMPVEIIDTVQEYTPIFGHRPNVKEMYLRFLGKELEQTHRALDDVYALFEALRADRFFEKIGMMTA